MTISVLNDENDYEALASNHPFLSTNARYGDGKLNISPAHNTEAEMQSTMTRCKPLHPQPSAENPHYGQEQELLDQILAMAGSTVPHPQPATQRASPVQLEDELLNQLLLEHPILEQEFSSSRFEDIEFDPIRPCRGAPLRGALPPPPRRFYAFWWRDVARAAYDAERAARLRRAREGGSVVLESTANEDQP